MTTKITKIMFTQEETTVLYDLVMPANEDTHSYTFDIIESALRQYPDESNYSFLFSTKELELLATLLEGSEDAGYTACYIKVMTALEPRKIMFADSASFPNSVTFENKPYYRVRVYQGYANDGSTTDIDGTLSVRYTSDRLGEENSDPLYLDAYGLMLWDDGSVFPRTEQYTKPNSAESEATKSANIITEALCYSLLQAYESDICIYLDNEDCTDAEMLAQLKGLVKEIEKYTTAFCIDIAPRWYDTRLIQRIADATTLSECYPER